MRISELFGEDDWALSEAMPDYRKNAAARKMERIRMAKYHDLPKPELPPRNAPPVPPTPTPHPETEPSADTEEPQEQPDSSAVSNRRIPGAGFLQGLGMSAAANAINSYNETVPASTKPQETEKTPVPAGDKERNLTNAINSIATAGKPMSAALKAALEKVLAKAKAKP